MTFIGTMWLGFIHVCSICYTKLEIHHQHHHLCSPDKLWRPSTIKAEMVQCSTLEVKKQRKCFVWSIIILKTHILQKTIKHAWKEPDVILFTYIRLSIDHKNSWHQKAQVWLYFRFLDLNRWAAKNPDQLLCSKNSFRLIKSC